jgi:hypothetical protein
MTRRKFVHRLIKACTVIASGVFAQGRKGSSRETKRHKFVRAFRVKGYPGPVKPMQSILKQGKWSG